MCEFIRISNEEIVRGQCQKHDIPHFLFAFSVSDLMKKSFHNVANRRDGCTMGAVFEVKKEIPDKPVC